MPPRKLCDAGGGEARARAIRVGAEKLTPLGGFFIQHNGLITSRAY